MDTDFICVANFRLKLLRVEFSSKQIALRISPHNLPFTDPRNHTVWVLGNQLTVAQTVDGYAGGFMIGIACAAGFTVQAVPNEKKTIVSRVQREREYVTCCSGTHTEPDVQLVD